MMNTDKMQILKDIIDILEANKEEENRAVVDKKKKSLLLTPMCVGKEAEEICDKINRTMKGCPRDMGKRQAWWDGLSESEKKAIKSLNHFDIYDFKNTMGIWACDDDYVGKVRIAGNTFYWDIENMDMNREAIQELETVPCKDVPLFVKKINDEYIFY